MKPTRHIVKPCKKLWRPAHSVWYKKNEDFKEGDDQDIKKATVSMKSLGYKDTEPNVKQMDWGKTETGVFDDEPETKARIIQTKSDIIGRAHKVYGSKILLRQDNYGSYKTSSFYQTPIRKWKQLGEK